jgi:medium-chain acyl-[acyl-carrier-protein] hydrolase
MQNILEKKFQVTSADSDFQRSLKVSSLVNMLIQIAWQHAEEMGYGVDSMNKTGLAWMLSRMQLKVDCLPLWNDAIKITTWPKGIRRLLYLRDFIVSDSNDNPLVKGTSEWLMIDINARRPKLRDPDNPAFKVNENKHAIEGEVPVLKIPEDDREIFHHITRYSDIDLNKHLTATRYIDLMFDCFDLEFFKNNRCKEIILNFMREVPFNEKININKVSLRDTNACQFEYSSENKQTVFFRGQLMF